MKFYLIKKQFREKKSIKGSYDLEKKFFSIDEGRESLNYHSTLLHIFKINGFDYALHKFDKILTYRDIEKTLIQFQTSYTVLIIFLYINYNKKGNFISRTSGIDFAGASEKNGGRSHNKKRKK
jgi:hypothetical protein